MAYSLLLMHRNFEILYAMLLAEIAAVLWLPFIAQAIAAYLEIAQCLKQTPWPSLGSCANSLSQSRLECVQVMSWHLTELIHTVRTELNDEVSTAPRLSR